MLLGTPLIALLAVSPLAWLAVAAYHVPLIVLLARDGVALPSARHASARRRVPQPFSLGARETVELSLAHPAAAGLVVEVADRAPLELRVAERTLRSRFDGQGQVTVAYAATSVRRGTFSFGTVDARWWREGGWWQRQVRLPAATEAVVQPNILAVKTYELYARRGLAGMPGLRRAQLAGASTAFAGLREYVPGDELRRVSWKATARRDSPVTSEFEAEKGQQMLVAVDCGRLMTAPAGALSKLDHAVNAALLLAWVSLRHGDRVGLMTFAEEVERFQPPRRGTAAIAALNATLASARAEYVQPDFRQALAYAARRLSRRSLVVVLSDLWDRQDSADLVEQALWLGRRHLVLMVAMGDPDIEAALRDPIAGPERLYEWAAAEELTAARRQSFDLLRRGGVLGLDVPAGELSPRLVEKYLELKERALL